MRHAQDIHPECEQQLVGIGGAFYSIVLYTNNRQDGTISLAKYHQKPCSIGLRAGLARITATWKAENKAGIKKGPGSIVFQSKPTLPLPSFEAPKATPVKATKKEDEEGKVTTTTTKKKKDTTKKAEKEKEKEKATEKKEEEKPSASAIAWVLSRDTSVVPAAVSSLALRLEATLSYFHELPVATSPCTSSPGAKSWLSWSVIGPK